MNKALLGLIIGMGFVIVSVLLISGPVKDVTAYHDDNGERFTAEITSKYMRKHTGKKSKYDRYRFRVKYRSKTSRFPHLQVVKDFVRKSEYKKLKKGSVVKISVLKKDKQSKKYPKVLLAETVDSSTIRKFAIALKGDPMANPLGLILLILGGISCVVSLMLVFKIQMTKLQ